MALANLDVKSLGGVGGHRTLAEKAFTVLHDAILTGRLQPGERLPIEDLALLLDMSPMPIREAVRRLDAAGLVENIPHRGARVTELSVEDLAEVYEARLVLEPLAVRHAAERFTEEDAELARDRLHRLEALAADTDAGAWSAHTDFHFALYDAARSRWLVRLIRPLWESSERYRISAATNARLSARSREHAQILQACIDHDPEAASSRLHAHLIRTADTIARAMAGKPLFSPAKRRRKPAVASTAD